MLKNISANGFGFLQFLRQLVDQPVCSQAAPISTGTQAQPTVLHAVTPPSASADVPVLPTATPTSQCTATAAVPKQEPAHAHGAVVSTTSPATQAVPAIDSTVNQSSSAASSATAALPTPAVFKQLTQPRTYNGSTSWKDYKAHYERVCKVNGWFTAQDKAQTLTLVLEGSAADVLEDVDELAPTAYEDIWTQLGRRFGYTDAPRDAMSRFDSRRQQDNESIQEFEQFLHLLHREACLAYEE